MIPAAAQDSSANVRASSPPEAPLISLIICTRNRGAQLKRCLASVAALQFPKPWELIIVDNGSTDETRSVVEAFAAAVPIPVLLVAEPRPGLARARNAGIARASGSIVCFTDDDCYPASDYLAQVERAFEVPGTAYVGGRVLLFDEQDARTTVKDDPQPRVFAAGEMITAGAVHGANMAVRREAFALVGGFDPLLGAGAPLTSGEDTDFLARLSAAGLCGRYDPRPLVYHHHGRRGQHEVRSLKRGYDVGRGAVYLKALLSRRTARLYARHWVARMRHGPPSRTYRELLGALLYCLHASRERTLQVLSRRQSS